MPRPLSNDLREPIVRAVDGGLSRNATARKLDVSVSALVKLIQQWKTTGGYLPKRVGGQRKHPWAGHEDKVNRLLSEKPDITVTEMQARLLAVRIKVCQSAITRFFIHLGHSYKKRFTPAHKIGLTFRLHALNGSRTKWRSIRRGWYLSMKQEPRPVWRGVTDTAKKGQQLLCKEQWGHSKTVTFTAALRLDGMTAPMVLDRLMDGEAFRVYVIDFLVPTLKPGDIVIMDNLPSHKVAVIEEAIAATGAKLRYLPPYSPDLNPIEQTFAKIKALLPKAAARSIACLHHAINRILSMIAPTECAAYLRNSGYCI